MRERWWLRPVLRVLSAMNDIANANRDDAALVLIVRLIRLALRTGVFAEYPDTDSGCRACGGRRVESRDDSDPDCGYSDPDKPWWLDCNGWAD